MLLRTDTKTNLKHLYCHITDSFRVTIFCFYVMILSTETKELQQGIQYTDDKQIIVQINQKYIFSYL